MNKFKRTIFWLFIATASLFIAFSQVEDNVNNLKTRETSANQSQIKPSNNTTQTPPIVEKDETQLEKTETEKSKKNDYTIENSSNDIEKKYQYYKITSVVDGDTVKIDKNGSIETLRLIGIDTPETVDRRKPVECFGREASNKAKSLLLNQEVRLESDPSQDKRDKYGRLLAYIYRQDGLFFNEWMIKNGFAYEYTYNTPYKYQANFKNSEKYARENEIGLWSPNACINPIKNDVSFNNSQESPSQTINSHTYYTSSYYTAKYYYCDTDSAWKGLSEKYLQKYSSEKELLNDYSRVLHEPCK